MHRRSWTRPVRRGYASGGGKALVPVSGAAAERNLAVQVAKLTRQVRLHKPEIKFSDIDVSATNVAVSDSYSELMSSVAAGTGINGRVGEKIRVVGFELNVLPVIDATSVDPAQANSAYRVLVCQFMQQVADSSNLGYAAVFDQAGLPFTALYTATQQNFVKILYDSGPIVLNGASVTTYGGGQRDERYWRRIKRKCNVLVEFNGTAAGDVQKNGIYVMYISNCLVGATSSLDIVATSRVFYSDM
jgi:hypothetical protein